MYSISHFGAILKGFGEPSFVDTFSGLQLGPKSYLVVSAAGTKVKNVFKSFGTIVVSASCTKVKNQFKSFGTIRKEFLLFKTTKNERYVPSLGKIPHFVKQPQRLTHAAQCCA